jgi:hypothetical protein
LLDERFELSKRWKAKKSKHGVDGDSDSSGLADVFTSLDAVFISQPEQIVRSGSRVASIHYISIYIYIHISEEGLWARLNLPSLHGQRWYRRLTCAAPSQENVQQKVVKELKSQMEPQNDQEAHHGNRCSEGPLTVVKRD